METFARYVFAFLCGVLAVLKPTLHFAFVLFFAILLDCWTAFDLSRRLKKQYPDRVEGKFQSSYALKMMRTFLEAYAVILILHYVDVVVLCNFEYMNLSNIAAALFCGVQLWSILENRSSANGARWAKMMQRFMVDKAKRHFNVDFESIEDETKDLHPS